jgi:imidazoleglycerol phosphate synthase glutamine amidotransferase subunit HisH
MGNLHSVKKKLDFLKVDSVISSDPAVILSASKLILPGVGHFVSKKGNIAVINQFGGLLTRISISDPIFSATTICFFELSIK